MITAINIETSLWEQLIIGFSSLSWKVLYKYENFDAGIDFDLIVLEKAGDIIYFGWDNWVEGEFQCNEHIMRIAEMIAGTRFELGETVNLKPEIIDLYFRLGVK